MNAYGIIMAGGNGERFWPVSTPERPKQFVDLFGGKPLIRHAADRLRGLIPAKRTIVITAERLVEQTRKALPRIPQENIIGEPCRRDTAAAVACACGLVKRLGGDDAVGCILAADHLIEPEEDFRSALRDCIAAAEATDSIVTMGIRPTFPATGFGYIESGAKLDCGTQTVIRQAKRFVEKPDAETARKYVKSRRFSWNAGMFIWKARTMEAAFAENASDIGALIGKIAKAGNIGATMKREYPKLRAISVDYAVMEKARKVAVAECGYEWDDVGSWLAIPNHFPSDETGNACIGKTALLDVKDSVIVSDNEHVTAVVGLNDVVVVQTNGATLVCAKNRVQDVKKIVKSLG